MTQLCSAAQLFSANISSSVAQRFLHQQKWPMKQARCRPSYLCTRWNHWWLVFCNGCQINRLSLRQHEYLEEIPEFSLFFFYLRHFDKVIKKILDGAFYSCRPASVESHCIKASESRESRVPQRQFNTNWNKTPAPWTWEEVYSSVIREDNHA